MRQLVVFALMSDGGRAVRVLVVDDDEVSREVLAVLLAGAGYGVETAESGDAALMRLRSAAGLLPDVLLVDMQMPGMVGEELAGRLRGECGDGAVLLAMSGSRPNEEARRGFDRFLLKPFTMGAFAAAIDGGVAGGAGEASGGAACALDEAVYEKLSASMKPVQVEQLYAMCLEDVERRIAGMRSAASSGDDAAYRREAHAIKGGCGMVGATELQTIATAMESRGIAANHVASLDEFLLACGRLRRILVAHKGS